MAKDWQAGLSMAERLSANMKITSASKRAFPEFSVKEAQAKGLAIEQEQYDTATSSDDYQRLCEIAVSRLLENKKKSPDLRPSQPESSPESHPEEQIGPYRARYHASGLFSIVYREASENLALKVTSPSLMSAPHNSYREARVLRLAAHDSIVRLISSSKIAGGHFLLAFPFYPFNLNDLLQRKALHPRQIHSHLRSMFTALAHIHSLSILHRDVKPSNLLLASLEGPAYLADFGIAWSEEDQDSEPAADKITDIGTTSYRAPELMFGFTAYNEAVDLWAAGCVVAEAVRQGKPLFDSGDAGSELALIKSIFTTLGTPDATTWPEAKSFPDWGKMQFTEYPAREWQDVLPAVSSEAQDIVSKLVKFEGRKRLKASEALRHPYFDDDVK